jgi:curved DNA-binding protein CbpA
MRPPTPDYYGILGVAQTATPEEIKKRYRELARRYHPDVAKTADDAGKFKEINEANRVLSDAPARARYDSELKLARLKAPEGERGRGEAGTKRTPPTSRPSQNAQRPNDPATQRPKPGVPGDVIEQAQKAFSRMKYREAEAVCRQALRTHGRSAPIYEILGDICRVRGRADEAIAMYSYALQLDRTNRSVQAKFDKLVGKTDASHRPAGATVTGTAARSARRAAPTATGPAIRRPPATAAITLFGLALVGLLIFLGARMDHAPATDWKLFAWDPLLLFSLSLSGAIVGFLMSLNGMIGPAKSELAMAGPQGRRSFPTLAGCLLLVYSLALTYAGLAYYVVVGLIRQSISKSVLTAFAASFFLTGVFAVLEQTSQAMLLMFGGNVVFAGFVAGWALADQVRR